MCICSFSNVRMDCLLHENATWSAEVLTDTGRKTGSLVHGRTRQEPTYMDVCRLRSRHNFDSCIPVSVNAMHTRAFSQQTDNVFGRLENWADACYRCFFFEESFLPPILVNSTALQQLLDIQRRRLICEIDVLIAAAYHRAGECQTVDHDDLALSSVA